MKHLSTIYNAIYTTGVTLHELRRKKKHQDNRNTKYNFLRNLLNYNNNCRGHYITK